MTVFDPPGIRRVAIGPVAPEFGSWNWLGADLAVAWASEFTVLTFISEVPVCDVVVFIKFKPRLEHLRAIARQAGVVYCPVDLYESAAAIDADWEALGLCSLIITHCDRLTRYFEPYARTVYRDHPLKFIAPIPEAPRLDGPIVWIGNRANLPPVVDWWRLHAPAFPEELWILTDWPQGSRPISTVDLGISSGRVERWSPQRHRDWTSLARGAIEIKGTDFRSRHKSSAKAHDFLASGVPVAMNADAAAVEHLRARGFEVATPEQREWWLSKEYWQRTVFVGEQLRQQLSLVQCASQFAATIRNLVTA